MRDLINAASKGSFGTTSSGSDWCIKALHPADPLTEVRGVPDRSAVPSILMNYQSTFSQSAPIEGVPWEFNMSLLPHPINFAFFQKNDSNGDNSSSEAFLNTQLEGDTHHLKYVNFSNLFKCWRLAYYSVTVVQDGPDLANQGTIVVCQKPVVPYEVNLAPPQFRVMSTGEGGIYAAVGMNYVRGCKKVRYCTDSDYPTYSTSQGMPNAYLGKSKEGAYIPLKLSETCQKWYTQADSSYWVDTTNVVKEPVGLGQNWPPWTDTVHVFAHNFATPLPFNMFPHKGLGLPVLHQNVAGTGDLCSTGSNIWGEETLDFMGDNWADICARNLAPTTSLTFYIRMGLEVQVQPQSPLAPHQKLSPPYDPVALDTYFMITRELKDAYPADFNDRSKMWDVIRSAIETGSDILGATGLGTFVKPIATGITRLGDYIDTRVQDRKAKQSIASPINIPAQREAIASKATNGNGKGKGGKRRPRLRRKRGQAAS